MKPNTKDLLWTLGQLAASLGLVWLVSRKPGQGLGSLFVPVVGQALAKGRMRRYLGGAR